MDRWCICALWCAAAAISACRLSSAARAEPKQCDAAWRSRTTRPYRTSGNELAEPCQCVASRSRAARGGRRREVQLTSRHRRRRRQQQAALLQLERGVGRGEARTRARLQKLMSCDAVSALSRAVANMQLSRREKARAQRTESRRAVGSRSQYGSSTRDRRGLACRLGGARAVRGNVACKYTNGQKNG